MGLPRPSAGPSRAEGARPRLAGRLHPLARGLTPTEPARFG
jgi:hypothetical protein